MIKREKIEHTPFWLIYDENKKGWFITMLNYQMTLPQPTREEALKDLDNRRWEIIAGMIEIIMVRVSNDAENLLAAEQLNKPDDWTKKNK